MLQRMKISSQFGQFSGVTFQVMTIIALKLVANHILLKHSYNLSWLPKCFAVASMAFGGIALFYAKRIFKIATSWRSFILVFIGFVPIWIIAISFLFRIADSCGYVVPGDHFIYLLAIPLSVWSSGVFHLINAIQKRNIAEGSRVQN